MKTSRRDFFSTLGIASGAFIAPKGMYAALAPERKLRMGVVSDVHISFSSPELWKWKKALKIDKKSLFRGTGTRPPACACPHADRLEPV
jgi:hypothetical protein